MIIKDYGIHKCKVLNVTLRPNKGAYNLEDCIVVIF